MKTNPGNGVSVAYSDIVSAAARLKGAANNTPVMTSRTADKRANARVFFKCENLQRTGAFKFRGAYNAIATLSQDARRRGLVAYSSGNHAQAMALAGDLLQTSVTVVMPKDAPQIKIRATEAYGGRILFYDRYTESREDIGRRLADAEGLVLVPSYDHPQVIAGQGTATKELLEEAGPFDRLFVCLGGGGLLAGAALAVHGATDDCKVIGVEPEAGNDGQQSFRLGRIVDIPVPKSIADGALTTHLGVYTFPIIRNLVEDIVTVSDAMLVDTMRFFAERMKLVVEPTGCLGAAAVLSGAFHRPGERIGVLISGGNVDFRRFYSLVGD